MSFARRDIFDRIAATLIMAVAVLSFTATHERWDVRLIGDSGRWAAVLLSALTVAMFAVATRHIDPVKVIALAAGSSVLAAWSLWTASLTALSMLTAAIVLVWLAALMQPLLRPLWTPTRGCPGEHHSTDTLVEAWPGTIDFRVHQAGDPLQHR